MFWWTSTSLQHRLNRRFGIKAPVHWASYVPESLFELISEPLQHRLNRCPYGACTGALKQAWTLCQNSNGYNWDTERPVEPTPQNRHPSVLPVLTVFLQWTSNGYVTLSTLYKGTPWLISVAFDTLNTWGHPWEEEKVLWAKERKSSTLIFNLEKFNLCKCSKCAWARANWV